MPGEYQTQIRSYDRLFDPANSEEYQLSIRLEPDGLSFSVYSPLHFRYIGLESLTFPDHIRLKNGPMAERLFLDYLNRTIAAHNVLSRPYQKVCIIFHSRFFTLVPGPLFNEQLSDEYLKFVHKTGPDQQAIVQHLSATDAKLVYSVHRELLQDLKSRFPGSRLFHETGVFLDSLIPRFKRAESSELLFVNIEYGSAGMIVLRGGTPVFCNIFESRTAEDTVYFIMFVIEQLALNPERTPLYLSGKTIQNSDLYRLISRYVRNVNLLEQSGSHIAGYATIQAETHRYYSILNPSLCES